jgi:hypothetical protein
MRLHVFIYIIIFMIVQSPSLTMHICIRKCATTYNHIYIYTILRIFYVYYLIIYINLQLTTNSKFRQIIERYIYIWSISIHAIYIYTNHVHLCVLEYTVIHVNNQNFDRHIYSFSCRLFYLEVNIRNKFAVIYTTFDRLMTDSNQHDVKHTWIF